MKSNIEKEVHTYFQGAPNAIFWPSDISNFVSEHRKEWHEFDLSRGQLAKSLLKKGVLRRAEFRSQQYPPIVRYLRGEPSTYELALSLRRNSFVSHKTALTLHGLESPTTTIYVNKEQGPKPACKGITQEGLNRAFKTGQRQSKYIFRYGNSQFVLISGKNTGRAGVTCMAAPDGASVDATDLERTLIDIVVRPAYAGA